MQRSMIQGASALLVGLTAGCASFTGAQNKSEPTNAGIEAALTDLGKGFSSLGAQLQGEEIGVIACRITIDLNVTASTEEADKLVLDAALKSPVKAIEGNADINSENSRAVETERGNTVKIEFVSPACLPKDTILSQDEDAKKKILDGGWKIFSKDLSSAR